MTEAVNLKEQVLTEHKDLDDRKKVLLDSSVEKKIEYVKELEIIYPTMNEILEVFTECHSSYNNSGVPDCCSVVGDSRVGKSTIAKHYKRLYPDLHDKNGVIKPVLISIVPCPAFIGSLVVRLLKDLGDPFYSKRDSVGRNTERLYNLLIDCKVQLLILEEVQHLVDRDNHKLIRTSADWFKDLIENTHIPIAFMGLPESRNIFKENEQLNGRVLRRNEIHPFEHGNKNFRVVLNMLDNELPFRYNN